MRKKLVLLGMGMALVLGAAASAQTAQGQPAYTPSAARPEMVDRFYRGRAIINAAAQAAGGVQALRGVTGLSYVAVGDVSNDVQGYNASRIGNSARDGAQRVVNRFDFAGSR
jgi:hypothetical protein